MRKTLGSRQQYIIPDNRQEMIHGKNNVPLMGPMVLVLTGVGSPTMHQTNYLATFKEENRTCQKTHSAHYSWLWGLRFNASCLVKTAIHRFALLLETAL